MNESIKELLASGEVVPDRLGSKRLVPAAQSVVVPVEPTPEMTMAGAGCLPSVDGVFGLAGALSANVWSAMLAAAPAPSSLAGGEVSPLVQRLAYGYAIMHTTICHMAGTSGASGRWYYDKANEAFGRVSPIHSITEDSNPHVNGDYFSGLSNFLAALSPEAPARETGGGAVSEAELRDAIALILPLAKGYAAAHPVGSNQSYVDYVDGLIALPPRHEAPASDEVFKQRDEAIRIAKRLHDTVESLIYGLPKYLNDTAQTDEENMIGKAWHVFDAAAYGLAALPEVEPVQDLHQLPQSVLEAPAEGAGEDLLSAIDAFMPSAEVAFLWSKETPPADEVQRYRERYWAVKDALLRARSSAPEAREGEAS